MTVLITPCQMHIYIHYSKHFKHLITLFDLNNLLGTVITLHFTQNKTDSERLNELFMVTQLGNGRAGIGAFDHLCECVSLLVLRQVQGHDSG